MNHWTLRLGRLLAACLCLLASCGSFEEKRIRELLHEKGFGTRATGEATKENYVSGRDRIQFLVSPRLLMLPDAEQLTLLQTPQPVEVDGTIWIPYVGRVYVLGKTEAELTRMVKDMLRHVFVPELDIEARIVGMKHFYAIGEVAGKGRHPLEPDLTLIDAMMGTVGWTNLANLGRVYVIRPDAENPLVIDVNFREMVLSGYTARNIRLHEHDVIYIPPTFLGLIARMLQRLLEPVSLAVQALFGFAQARVAYDVATGEEDYFFRF